MYSCFVRWSTSCNPWNGSGPISLTGLDAHHSNFAATNASVPGERRGTRRERVDAAYGRVETAAAARAVRRGPRRAAVSAWRMRAPVVVRVRQSLATSPHPPRSHGRVLQVSLASVWLPVGYVPGAVKRGRDYSKRHPQANIPHVPESPRQPSDDVPGRRPTRVPCAGMGVAAGVGATTRIHWPQCPHVPGSSLPDHGAIVGA